MNRCALLSTLLVALAGCATPAPAERARTAPDPEPANGGIAWFVRDDYLAQYAAWRDGLVVAGPRGGPVKLWFTREANGRWTGPGQYGLTVELAVEGSRITGPTVDITFTRVEGGFRLAGLWFRENVDLTVDGKGARAQHLRFVRDPDGAYVSTDSPGQAIVLIGDAARLDDPPWPELPLAALLSGWGVKNRNGPRM